MGELGTIAKIVIVLGIVFLFIGLIGGNDGPWVDFTNTVSNPPSFANPFDERYEAPLPIVDDGSVPPATVTNGGSVEDCVTSGNPTADWWGCLLTNDGATSYASVNDTEPQFRVDFGSISGVPYGYPVLALRIVTECRGVGSDVEFSYQFYDDDDTTLVASIPVDRFTCPAGEFANVTVFNEFDSPYLTIGQFTLGHLAYNPIVPIDSDYSFTEITVIYGTSAECPSGDSLAYIGCIIAGFFNFIVKILRVIVNGLIFIGQIIVYLLSIVFFFIIAVGSLIVLPGAPAIVQGIIGAAVIAFIMMILLTIIGIARGSGVGV